MKKEKIQKILNFTLTFFLIIVAAVLIFSLYINCLTVDSGRKKIISESEAAKIKDVDCILVLGCSVNSDKTLSVLLRDRVDTAISLYFKSGNTKLLMSGDNSSDLYYDEVGSMRDYAVGKGVDENDILLDGKGLSTYESILHAVREFGFDKIIIVTQEYHLYRCIYVAGQMGIEAYGVKSDISTYSESTVSFNKNREFFARIKDYFYCKFD